MLGSVVFQADRRVGGVRTALTAAALVEQDDPVNLGVEHLAAATTSPAAGAAVHPQRRLPAGVAAGFPVDLVAIADIQKAPCVRFDRRERLGHGALLEGAEITPRGYSLATSRRMERDDAWS